MMLDGCVTLLVLVLFLASPAGSFVVSLQRLVVLLLCVLVDLYRLWPIQYVVMGVYFLLFLGYLVAWIQSCS